MRKLVLVELFWTRDKDPRVPLAMGSLLAATREAGINVHGLSRAINDDDFSTQETFSTIANLIDADGYTDVGFGVYVWNEEAVQFIGRALREEYPELRIILGGPQISYSGPGLEDRYPFGSAFVRGYGESALVDIMTHSGHPSIEGVHWNGTTDQCKQARIDLESIPSPFLSGTIDISDQRFIRWEAKRGCSFKCSFCQHREAGKRLTRRELQRKRLMKEIGLFCDSNVDDIAVLDPIFNEGADYLAVLEAFCDHNYEGHLSLQCRFEFVDESFLELASTLNCTLEFGLQTIHRDEGQAVKRPNHLPKVDSIISKLHQHNIDFEVSLIFGLPRQTLSSFEESVAYCIDRSVPVIKAFPLMLLRGTLLDRQRDQWGLVESDDPIPMVTSSNTYTREDWHRMGAISEALKETEEEHPHTLNELRMLADTHAPDPRRWTPSHHSA